MTLPYKVYTVCRRALEDVYSSKGGSLRMGGDFRCFHLDVAGFYRLLEMMVAFGRVVDQVAEFEAFHLFPVLSVVADPDDTGYRALTALFLRGEWQSRLPFAGCRGRWRGIARSWSAIFHPS